MPNPLSTDVVTDRRGRAKSHYPETKESPLTIFTLDGRAPGDWLVHSSGERPRATRPSRPAGHVAPRFLWSRRFLSPLTLTQVCQVRSLSINLSELNWHLQEWEDFLRYLNDDKSNTYEQLMTPRRIASAGRIQALDSILRASRRMEGDKVGVGDWDKNRDLRDYAQELCILILATVLARFCFPLMLGIGVIKADSSYNWWFELTSSSFCLLLPWSLFFYTTFLKHVIIRKVGEKDHENFVSDLDYTDWKNPIVLAQLSQYFLIKKNSNWRKQKMKMSRICNADSILHLMNAKL